MRTLVLVLFGAALFAAALSCAQSYTLGPDSLPQSGAPKGSVTKYTLPPGKFYPGTPHDYSIYAPAQYDAAKPTPFMIFFDRNGTVSMATGRSKAASMPHGLRQPDRQA